MNDEDMSTSTIGVAGEPGNGPYVILKVTQKNGNVLDVEPETNGCPAAYSAVIALTLLCKGREVARVRGLEAADLLQFHPLPEGKEYYAGLAIEAMQKALAHR